MEKTIIQSMDALCSNLHIAMREKKEQMHYTSQDLADISGVPLSNIKKFFSGLIKSPNVFFVMALCICLNLSLDDLLGNDDRVPPDNSESAARLSALEAENIALKNELRASERISVFMEDALKVRRRIIYSLLAICASMSFFLLHYFSLDRNNPNVGLVQHDGVSPLAFVLFGLVALAVGIAVAVFVIGRKYKIKKDWM